MLNVVVSVERLISFLVVVLMVVLVVVIVVVEIVLLGRFLLPCWCH